MFAYIERLLWVRSCEHIISFNVYCKPIMLGLIFSIFLDEEYWFQENGVTN